jgi:hypothetical protein
MRGNGVPEGIRTRVTPRERAMSAGRSVACPLSGQEESLVDQEESPRKRTSKASATQAYAG